MILAIGALKRFSPTWLLLCNIWGIAEYETVAFEKYTFKMISRKK